MDKNKDPLTITTRSVAKNEIPAGGKSESPSRSTTITKDPGTSKTSNRKAPFEPRRRTTEHNDIPDITVPIESRPPGFPPATQKPVDRFTMDPDKLEDLDFPQRLAVLGGPSLFGKTESYNIELNTLQKSYNIELATLQRMAIHDLQHRLVRLVAHIHNNQYADEGAMDLARRLLNEYSTSIRNYDLMSEKKERSQTVGHRDPFLITTEDRISFILMEREGLFRHPGRSGKRIRLSTDKYRQMSTAWDLESNVLPGESRTSMRERNEVRFFFERLTLGIFGGLAIIAPMLVMALSNSLLVSLIVTSVTTMVFAMLLALPKLGGTLDGKTVLATVAAYAAILVVFVGTSLSVT